MCGIVGYIGRDDAVGFLTSALKRLEYRGYDSAGMATLNGHGLEVRKAPGKIARLESVMAAEPPQGRLGIAHTRWATHGRPSEINAHPHLDCHGHVAVVHNGIIENHRQLRDELIADGHVFRSETDSEVIAHLLERFLSKGLPEAMRRAAGLLRGSFAIACIADDAPDMIVALRGGHSPLVMGIGDQEAYLASDSPALLGRAQHTLALSDGELAVLTRQGITIRKFDGTRVNRAATPITGDRASVEKGGYPHFMLKEIFEQPKVVRHTLLDRADRAAGEVHLPELGLTDRQLTQITRVAFLACGTSWHSGLLGRYLIEQLARLPVDAELASECRHRLPIYGPRVLAVPISQSGETADTLAALEQARLHRARCIAICNAAGSSIARAAEGVLDMRAGLEIGVAATKSFVSQAVAVTLLALKLGVVRGRLDRHAVRDVLRAVHGAADVMEEMLSRSDEIRVVAERLADRSSCLYLGRGLQYPLALEGALKLKEISYVHAEGYAAGEMKHGPIALVDRGTPVIALAPQGPTSAAMASNIQEVKARDGMVVALVTRGDDAMARLADVAITVPPVPPEALPLVLAVPLQLLAYHLAVHRGCDVDQPRNLAKSVTVE